MQQICVLWGPTRLLPSWVFCQFNADGWKPLKGRLRASAQIWGWITTLFHPFTAFCSRAECHKQSEHSRNWIPSLCSLYSLILFCTWSIISLAKSNQNRLQRNWKERAKMCPTNHDPLQGCFGHNQFVPVVTELVLDMFNIYLYKLISMQKQQLFI